MAKPTRSMLVAVVLLALAEVGLRLRTPETGALPRDAPSVLILGSSRTVRGLRPISIEGALQERGLPAWTVNLARAGDTTVGLYRRYLEQVSPLAAATPGPRVLAIEVRGSGLNDAYVQDHERAWLERAALSPLPEDAASDLPPTGLLANLRVGDFEAAARALVGSLAIARGRETLRPLLPLRMGGTGAPAAWAAGDPEKGWQPFQRDSAPALRWSALRDRYQNLHLRDFSLGGLQTHALRLLVRRARRDGFRPLLFVMPVTERHKGFFAPGDLQALRDHLSTLARSESVPLLDLDADLELPSSAFYDTHHVNAATAELVSRHFAKGLLTTLAP